MLCGGQSALRAPTEDELAFLLSCRPAVEAAAAAAAARRAPGDGAPPGALPLPPTPFEAWRPYRLTSQVVAGTVYRVAVRVTGGEGGTEGERAREGERADEEGRGW